MLLVHLKKAAFTALWFAFLTFPLLVIKVNIDERVIIWRWQNLLYAATAGFLGSLTVAAVKAKKKHAVPREQLRLFDKAAVRLTALAALLLAAAAFPHLVSIYQVNIMITALLYVMLGLGLNIVVGMAGLAA